MPTLYKVTDPNGALVMIAPIDTLRRVFDLKDGALDRVARETSTGSVCDLHFNYGRTKLGLAKIDVEIVS